MSTIPVGSVPTQIFANGAGGQKTMINQGSGRIWVGQNRDTLQGLGTALDPGASMTVENHGYWYAITDTGSKAPINLSVIDGSAVAAPPTAGGLVTITTTDWYTGAGPDHKSASLTFGGNKPCYLTCFVLTGDPGVKGEYYHIVIPPSPSLPGGGIFLATAAVDELVIPFSPPPLIVPDYLPLEVHYWGAAGRYGSLFVSYYIVPGV